MRDDKQQMSLIRIVQRLWGHVYDLLFLIKGTGKKDLETIEMELDLTECYCRPYAQDDEGEETPDESQDVPEEAV